MQLGFRKPFTLRHRSPAYPSVITDNRDEQNSHAQAHAIEQLVDSGEIDRFNHYGSYLILIHDEADDAVRKELEVRRTTRLSFHSAAQATSSEAGTCPNSCLR